MCEARLSVDNDCVLHMNQRSIRRFPQDLEVLCTAIRGKNNMEQFDHSQQRLLVTPSELRPPSVEGGTLCKLQTGRQPCGTKAHDSHFPVE